MNIRNNSMALLAAMALCMPAEAPAQQNTQSKVVKKTDDKATADAKVFEQLSNYSGI